MSKEKESWKNWFQRKPSFLETEQRILIRMKQEAAAQEKQELEKRRTDFFASPEVAPILSLTSNPEYRKAVRILERTASRYARANRTKFEKSNFHPTYPDVVSLGLVFIFITLCDPLEGTGYSGTLREIKKESIHISIVATPTEQIVSADGEIQPLAFFIHRELIEHERFWLYRAKPATKQENVAHFQTAEDFLRAVARVAISKGFDAFFDE